MIEVFKTDVKDYDHATMLVNQIHTAYSEYSANFDLQDCDNILRVKSSSESIESECLINLLRNFGFHAEVLPDDCVDHNLLPKAFLRLIS